MITFVAIAALAVLVLWGVGGFLARLVGIVLVIEELARLALDGASSPTSTVPLLAVGVGLWLFGHWHYAVKHRVWRSALALRAWSLPGLYRLAPIPTDHRPRRQSSWPEYPVEV